MAACGRLHYLLLLPSQCCSVLICPLILEEKEGRWIKDNFCMHPAPGVAVFWPYRGRVGTGCTTVGATRRNIWIAKVFRHILSADQDRHASKDYRNTSMCFNKKSMI
ncbi:hypothetical protein B0H10DRAFT_1951450 [Mycena sp. CBHHK59/15]|nr:hypothetical protein B0H10DRAFT_1951450 [Mycena sp. CBHHK59/15]